MYFYELHEGDDELYSDVILAHDEEIPAEDFYDIVQEIRRRIRDTFDEDTLIEAIAVELEREHGFLYVSDDRITAAVNVSKDDSDNYLIATEDEFGALGMAGVDYEGVLLDFEGDDGSRVN